MDPEPEPGKCWREKAGPGGVVQGGIQITDTAQLKKITKKPVCSVCVIWIHFEFNPGRKKDKRERGKKKEKKKKEIFPPTNKILQILTGDYKRQ